MTKVPRTRDELVELYQEQWRFLRSSSAAFDAGDSAEAKRLAIALRILLHESKNATSLLSQLSLDEALFFDAAQHVIPGNIMPTFGLVVVEMTNDAARYVAPLGGFDRGAWLVPFNSWWNRVVVTVPGRYELTRKDLVLTMADQDGGAHVDPALDARYASIRQDADVNFAVETPEGRTPLVDLERVSVRQIAHEAMVSLIEPHRVIPNNLPEEDLVSYVAINHDLRTGDVRRAIVQRRPLCPCDSGVEYPACHGKGGANEGKVTQPRAR